VPDELWAVAGCQFFVTEAKSGTKDDHPDYKHNMEPPLSDQIHPDAVLCRAQTLAPASGILAADSNHPLGVAPVP
jgi:hypothetical protein